MDAAPDPRRAAGAEVLGRLAGPGSGPDTIVRDGVALLVRRGDVLVRVRPVEDRSTAEREVLLAGTLHDLGVPVTELVARHDQPWTVDTCVVTAWRWVEATGAAGPADLGALARTLRERAAQVTLTLPTLEPLAVILGAVAGLPADDPEARFVRERAAALAEPFADADSDDPLGRSLVHGDLHADNVVVGPAGPLLTDLELAGVGPATYDAAPAALAVRRYGHGSDSLDSFLAAFGADPRGWAGFATFVAVFELWATAWAVGVRSQDPAWAAEAARRVAALRDGADVPWTLS
jgi:hypothetical protein